MSKKDRLKRWREILVERNWTVKQATMLLKVSEQTGYNWNCGLQPIPPGRLEQLEKMNDMVKPQ